MYLTALLQPGTYAVAAKFQAGRAAALPMTPHPESDAVALSDSTGNHSRKVVNNPSTHVHCVVPSRYEPITMSRRDGLYSLLLSFTGAAYASTRW